MPRRDRRGKCRLRVLSYNEGILSVSLWNDWWKVTVSTVHVSPVAKLNHLNVSTGYL